MSRPVKWRKVEFLPKSTYFGPLNKPKCELEEIILKVEELESIRLKDIEELSQEECADRMKISRQTFQNIIDSARKKIGISLTEDKVIHITGGNYTKNICHYGCSSCNHTYETNYENREKICPNCNSKDVSCIQKENSCLRGCSKRKCNKHLMI